MIHLWYCLNGETIYGGVYADWALVFAILPSAFFQDRWRISYFDADPEPYIVLTVDVFQP